MKKLFALLLLTMAVPFANAQQPVSNNDENNEAIFSVVENEPEFPGGVEALYKFISKNVVYPKKALKNGIEGKVVVEFVIEANGSVTNVKVFKSVNPDLDKEAVRVVSMMPKWKPGSQGGKNVRSRFRIPINFQLNYN